MYELNHALVLAFDQAAAGQAWLADGDPLAPAALGDVPTDEMAEAYDRLRSR